MVKQTNQMFASQCCRQGCSLHQHYAKAYSNSSTTRLMRVEMCIIQMAQFHISPKQRHTLRRTKNHCFIINIPDIYSNRRGFCVYILTSTIVPCRYSKLFSNNKHSSATQTDSLRVIPQKKYILFIRTI